MLKDLKAVFFDLDNTLWNFSRNSISALEKLYNNELKDYFEECKKEIFIRTYEKYNNIFWEEYKKGNIDVEKLKIERFLKTFEELKIDVRNYDEMNEIYLDILAEENILIESALDILLYVKEKYYLGILTNGFYNTQIKKMKNSGIYDYVELLVASDEVGIVKPNKEIFDYAAKKSGFDNNQILYVGDEYATDVVGSINAGFQCIWFNRNNEKVPENVSAISCLEELKEYI